MALCVVYRSVEVFLQFPPPIGNLDCSDECRPSLPGDLERGRSFVSRRWPILVYFAPVDLGGTLPVASAVLGARYQLGVSCGVFLE